MKTEFKALKYKLMIPNKHLYSCGFILLNDKTKNIERMCCVISYNPAVFEIDVKQNIEKIESVVYKYKFDEGCCSDLTKKLYVCFHDLEKQLITIIEKEIDEEMKRLLIEILDKGNTTVKFDCFIERLKYTISDVSDYSKIESNVNKFSGSKFFIKAKPVIDNKKGISIAKIKPKNEILCELTDNREIVKHIMRILFSKDKDEKKFYAEIVDINKRNERYYEITCYLTQIIFTKIIIEKNQKIIIKK